MDTAKQNLLKAIAQNNKDAAYSVHILTATPQQLKRALSYAAIQRVDMLGEKLEDAQC